MAEFSDAIKQGMQIAKQAGAMPTTNTNPTVRPKGTAPIGMRSATPPPGLPDVGLSDEYKEALRTLFSAQADAQVLTEQENQEKEMQQTAQPQERNFLSEVGYIPETAEAAPPVVEGVGFLQEFLGESETIQQGVNAVVQDGMIANLWKYVVKELGLAPNETERKKLLGIGENNYLKDYERQLNTLYEQGQENSPEFRAIVNEYAVEKQAIDDIENVSFSLEGFKSALVEHPGSMTAALFDAVVADPVLALTPVGWQKAAGQAALVAARVGAQSKVALAAARVAGGVGGSATVGGTLGAAISLSEELSQEEEINWKNVAQASGVAATLSPLFVGPLVGVGTLARRGFNRSAKHTMKEPDIDELVMLHRSVGADAVNTQPTSTLAETANNVWSRAKNTWVGKAVERINDGLFRKSISLLDDASQKSPTLRKLRNMIEHEEFSTVPRGRDFFEEVGIATGRYMGRVNETLDTLARQLKRATISPALEREIIRGLRGKPVTGYAIGAVQMIRQVLDSVYAYGEKRGAFGKGNRQPGYLKDYFLRVYDVNKIRKDEQGFMTVLHKHGLDAEEANNVVRKLYANDEGNLLDLEPIEMDVSGRVLPAKVSQVDYVRRLQHIPDDVLEPYLENKLYGLLSRSVQGTVRRAHYTESFGKKGEKIPVMLKDIQTELADSGRLLSIRESQRIVDLVNALGKAYKPIRDPWGRKTNSMVLTYQFIRTLPWALLSSLTEVFIPFLRGGGMHAARALGGTVGAAGMNTVRWLNRVTGGKTPIVPKHRMVRAAEDVGLALDAAVTERLAATFGGEVNQITTTFFKIIGLEQFTRFNRVMAYETGRNMVFGHLKELALNSNLDKATAGRMMRELAELGVEVGEGITYTKIAQFMDDISEGYAGAKTVLAQVGDQAVLIEPTTPQVAQYAKELGVENLEKFLASFEDKVKTAGVRFTNEVVMAPRATVRPMWMSNPHYALVAQLKGFQVTFGNTVLKRLIHDMRKYGLSQDARIVARNAAVVGLMLYSAAQIHGVRQWIKYGEGAERHSPKTNTDWLLEAVDRTGLAGMVQLIDDARTSRRFGGTALGAILGPAAAQVEQLAMALGAKDKSRALRRQLYQAIPGLKPIDEIQSKASGKTIKEIFVGEQRR